MTASKAKGTRIPTALVLALVGAMLSVGGVAIYAALNAPPPRPEQTVSTELDLSTPERAAESFLDAWRKRDHAGARAASVGAMLTEVEAREARDTHLTAEERDLKRQIWDQLAEDRLRLVLNESLRLDPDEGREALALGGVARGRFLGEEYEREVSFELVEIEDGWRVRSMELGAILSDAPDFLRLEE